MENDLTLQSEAALYATPRKLSSVDECYFYHTMDLPNHGTVTGEWDLRKSIDEYLGHYDFSGKRVLDVGAASGELTFHIERRGADVVSFDLSEDYDWDIVPFAVNDHSAERARRRDHLRKINNGYWFAHAAFDSAAKMVNGIVYDIPNEIGPVDVAVYGSILLHLRDPFLALENGARLCTDTMIVTDISPYGKLGSKFFKRPRFMPRADRPNWITDGWFRLPPLLVVEYLKILGFPNTTISWSEHKYGSGITPLYTVIGRR